jgi:ubiquinone/menaquinone biosynthesis C-methylase UbiE
MQPELYRLLFQNERRYWWSRARRDLTVRLCRAFGFTSQTRPVRILDVGCGTGALLHKLSEVGSAYGVDESEVALEFCHQSGLRRIARASAEQLPIADASFDVVTSLDVLEHLTNDTEAIREIHRVLVDRGLLILMVPAFQMLWTDRDDRLGHRRRYRRGELGSKLVRAGFDIQYCRYTNPTLFPIILGAIAMRRALGQSRHVSTDVASVPGILNELLFRWVVLENWVALKSQWAFGTTLLAVATKRSKSDA